MRKMADRELEALKITLAEYMRFGAYHRCTSGTKFSSPALVVFHRQISNKWRVVQDLRRLNSMSEVISYGMPCTEELVERVSGGECWSVLDDFKGFWGVIINCDKTR